MMGFPVEQAIRKRISVRTYDRRPVEAAAREKLMEYAASLENPLGPKVRFQLIDKTAASGGEKLGTYGVIKGAELYIGAAVPDAASAPEALGYDFERLVLYLTDLGLGTCWLGGTFNKGAFAEVMNVKEGELFPIVSPVGYPAPKRSLTERMMRIGAKADQRFPWEKLFYKEDFSTPLSKEEAGDYAFVLEMVRLAPSAVNRQPWRVVRSKDGVFHFFQANLPGNEEDSTVDIHRIDLGIAICHFHLAAQEKGLTGRFERQETVAISGSEKMAYITSWAPQA